MPNESTPRHHGHRALVPMLAIALMLGACMRDRPVTAASERWPDAECRRLGEDDQLDPVALTSAALLVFRNQVIPRARETGRTFPAYAAWMSEVTNAVRRHEVTDAGEASDRAQDEFEGLIPPIPATHDLENRAAMREQTRFREMARNITKRMRCQMDARRATAVANIRSRADDDEPADPWRGFLRQCRITAGE